MTCGAIAKYVWHAAGCAHQTVPVRLTGLNLVCPLQVAQKPFRLTDDFVAPKGTLIMPSIVAANMQVSPPCVQPSHYLHTQRQQACPDGEDMQPSCVLPCACKLQRMQSIEGLL